MSITHIRIFLFWLGAMSFAVAAEASQPVRLTQKAESLTPSYALIDINSIALYIQNNGIFASDPVTAMSGLYYPNRLDGLPNRNKALIYTSSLMLAAMIKDSLCAMINAYTPDAVPGAMPAPDQPIGRNDPAFRVYKIGTTTDLLNSADYRQWPTAQGAPTGKNNRPLLMGDQMLFCSFTDGYPYPDGHENTRTLPMGAEIHMTAWAWQDIDDIVFLQWQIINQSGTDWRQACLGFFSDCEVGQANDDLAASDSTLNLVYAYNGDDADDVYGSAIPSVGYAFVQRPLIASEHDTTLLAAKRIKGFRQGSARAPLHYKQGLPGARGEWGDFHIGRTYGAWQAFWRMQGISELGHHMINPVTGLETDWGLSGDPVAASGWLDYPAPHDRRFGLATGPLDWVRGDTQTVAIAIVVGQGADRWQSIGKLKENAAFADQAYHSHAIVYVVKGVADPSLPRFQINIGCINPLTPLRDLQFDLVYDPGQIAITSAAATSRAHGLPITMTEVKPGVKHIRVNTGSAYVPEGLGAIIKLDGLLKQTTTGATSHIDIDKPSAMDASSQPLRIIGHAGDLHIDRLPPPVRWRQPSNDTQVVSISQLKQLHVSWTGSQDPDGDSLLYHVEVVGRPEPVCVSADTQCVLDATRFFQQDSIYQCTVSAWAGGYAAASPDTISIHIGHIQNVNLEKRSFAFEYDFIDKAEIDGHHLYWLVGEQVGGNIAYRIVKFDVTIPSQPRVLGDFQLPDKPYWWRTMAVKSGVVYLASGGTQEGHLWTIDLREMATAAISQSAALLGRVLHLALQENLLMLLGPGNCINQYRISDLLQPVFVRRIDLPFAIDQGRTWQHGCVLYHSQGGQLSIYTVASDVTIKGPASLAFSTAITAGCADDRVAVVMTESITSPWSNVAAGELHFIDVSSPLSPQIKSKTLLPTNGFAAQVISSYPFVYRVQYPMLEIFNVKDLLQPLQVGYYYPVQTPMAIQGSWLYGRDSDHMLVLRYLTEEQITGESGGRAFKIYQNFPNPFNQETMFYYDVFREADVEIKIFNVLGEEITTLLNEKKPIGSYWATWGGSTDGEGRCGSGLYFCRIKAEDRYETIKLIRLR